ncbi:hypothetical protein LINGRAHAP2_LOCUS36505, partial [Linum grandiflorum]
FLFIAFKNYVINSPRQLILQSPNLKTTIREKTKKNKNYGEGKCEIESVEKLEQKLKNEIEKNKWLEMEWLLKCKDDDHLQEASSSGHKDLNDLVNMKSKNKMVDKLIRKVDKQVEYLKNKKKNK